MLAQYPLLGPFSYSPLDDDDDLDAFDDDGTGDDEDAAEEDAFPASILTTNPSHDEKGS